MKFIKLFVFSVVILFSLLTAFSSLLPSTVRISRAIDINSSPEIVLAGINDLKQWEQWNEYIKALAVKTVTSQRIESDRLSVLITASDKYTVHTQWRQKNGKIFPGDFNLIPNTSFITLQWYFVFTVKWYPWEKFGSIIYDEQLGPQMEKSLQNLKLLLEKAP